jgi:hypothetical protein
LIGWAGEPRIYGTDSCSARCGAVEKRRSPRAGLRARKFGPSRTARRGGTPSWACPRLRRSRAPRPSNTTRQCTLDPARSRDRRAVPSGYRPPRCRRRSGCDCVCPCVAVPWSMVWRQRAGPPAPDGPRELTARELAVVRPCHGSRHPQVAGLLVVQAPVGWLVVPRDVDVAVADFEGKEYVDPFQGDRAVDVEEVHGEHG